MKNARKMIWVIAVLMLALSLAACAGNEQPAATDDSAATDTDATAQAQVNLTMGTGGTGGPLQATGAAIASTIHNHTDDMFITVAVTGGGAENMNLVSQNAMDFGFTSTPDGAMYLADNPEQYGTLRTLFTYYYGGLQLAVLSSSDIYSFEDLRGKKISMGAPGSSLELFSKYAMEAHGLAEGDYDGQLLNLSTAAGMLKDGTLDATFYFSPAPISHLIDVCASQEIRLIPFTDEGVENFMEMSSGWQVGAWEPGVYSNMENTEPCQTVVTSWTVFTNEFVEDEVVKEFLTVMFDNLPEVAAAYAGASTIGLETALDDAPFEVHPAALEFYADQGVTP